MSLQQSAIYVTGPLPRDGKTSSHFTSFKAIGSPTTVGESRLSMFTTTTAILLRMYFTWIAATIMAYITNGDIDYGATASYTLPATKEDFDMADRPQLTVSMPGAKNEAKINRLIAAGFTQRTNGRYKYFVGPPTKEATEAAVQQGVVIDAFAPGNTTSVHGLLTFVLMSRILHHFFSVVTTIAATKPVFASFSKIKAPTTPIVMNGGRFTEANLSTLPEKGFFFGYFDGMLLPDHGWAPATFIAHFNKLFGTPSQMVDTTRVIMSGWSSLSDTSAGKVLSHIIYCVNLAIMNGIEVRPVYLQGEYAGCVFSTSASVVHKGTMGFKPSSSEQLKEQIALMRSHDTALAEICQLLSQTPVGSTTEQNDDGEEEEVPIPSATVLVPSDVSCPRIIHNYCRTKTFPTEVIQSVNNLLKKLRFNEKSWEVVDSHKVAVTTALILSKEFPDISVPFNYRAVPIWTKNPCLSALAAYGLKAPSLRGTGTGMVKRISHDTYQVAKPGSLVGIPIFAKAHDRAQEDWEGAMHDYAVWWDFKGVDKLKQLRVSGVSSYIPIDGDNGKSIRKALGDFAGRSKRKADDAEVEKPGVSVEEAARKVAAGERRIKGYGVVSTIFGVSVPTVVASGEAMEQDDDIYA